MEKYKFDKYCKLLVDKNIKLNKKEQKHLIKITLENNGLYDFNEYIIDFQQFLTNNISDDKLPKDSLLVEIRVRDKRTKI